MREALGGYRRHMEMILFYAKFHAASLAHLGLTAKVGYPITFFAHTQSANRFNAKK